MKPTHSSFTLLALHHGTRAGRRVDYFSINTLLLFFVVFFFFLQFGFYLHTKNEKGDITCESASCRKGVVYNWSELAFPRYLCFFNIHTASVVVFKFKQLGIHLKVPYSTPEYPLYFPLWICCKCCYICSCYSEVYAHWRHMSEYFLLWCQNNLLTAPGNELCITSGLKGPT